MPMPAILGVNKKADFEKSLLNNSFEFSQLFKRLDTLQSQKSITADRKKELDEIKDLLIAKRKEKRSAIQSQLTDRSQKQFKVLTQIGDAVTNISQGNNKQYVENMLKVVSTQIGTTTTLASDMFKNDPMMADLQKEYEKVRKALVKVEKGTATTKELIEASSLIENYSVNLDKLFKKSGSTEKNLNVSSLLNEVEKISKKDIPEKVKKQMINEVITLFKSKNAISEKDTKELKETLQEDTVDYKALIKTMRTLTSNTQDMKLSLNELNDAMDTSIVNGKELKNTLSKNLKNGFGSLKESIANVSTKELGSTIFSSIAAGFGPMGGAIDEMFGFSDKLSDITNDLFQKGMRKVLGVKTDEEKEKEKDKKQNPPSPPGGPNPPKKSASFREIARNKIQAYKDNRIAGKGVLGSLASAATSAPAEGGFLSKIGGYLGIGGAGAAGAGAGAAGGGLLARAGGLLRGAGSAVGGVAAKAAIPLLAAKGVYDGVTGWNNTEENYGDKSTGTKFASASNKILKGVSFGMLDMEKMTGTTDVMNQNKEREQQFKDENDKKVEKFKSKMSKETFEELGGDKNFDFKKLNEKVKSGGLSKNAEGTFETEAEKKNKTKASDELKAFEEKIYGKKVEPKIEEQKPKIEPVKIEEPKVISSKPLIKSEDEKTKEFYEKRDLTEASTPVAHPELKENNDDALLALTAGLDSNVAAQAELDKKKMKFDENYLKDEESLFMNFGSGLGSLFSSIGGGLGKMLGFGGGDKPVDSATDKDFQAGYNSGKTPTVKKTLADGSSVSADDSKINASQSLANAEKTASGYKSSKKGKGSSGATSSDSSLSDVSSNPNMSNMQKTLAVISKQEGNASSVNRDDAGKGVSLGKLQWHGDRARNLLRDLKKADPEKFEAVMGKETSNMIEDNKKSWHLKNGQKVTFNKEQSDNFKELMKDPKMQEVQQNLADKDVMGYMSKAQKKGITDPAAQAYYADVVNQYGSAKALDNASDKSLDGLHAIMKAKGEYGSRRDAVYKGLKKINFDDKKDEKKEEKVKELVDDKKKKNEVKAEEAKKEEIKDPFLAQTDTQISPLMSSFSETSKIVEPEIKSSFVAQDEKLPSFDMPLAKSIPKEIVKADPIPIENKLLNSEVMEETKTSSLDDFEKQMEATYGKKDDNKLVLDTFEQQMADAYGKKDDNKSALDDFEKQMAGAYGKKDDNKSALDDFEKQMADAYGKKEEIKTLSLDDFEKQMKATYGKKDDNKSALDDFEKQMVEAYGKKEEIKTLSLDDFEKQMEATYGKKDSNKSALDDFEKQMEATYGKKGEIKTSSIDDFEKQMANTYGKKDEIKTSSIDDFEKQMAGAYGAKKDTNLFSDFLPKLTTSPGYSSPLSLDTLKNTAMSGFSNSINMPSFSSLIKDPMGTFKNLGVQAKDNVLNTGTSIKNNVTNAIASVPTMASQAVGTFAMNKGKQAVNYMSDKLTPVTETIEPYAKVFNKASNIFKASESPQPSYVSTVSKLREAEQLRTNNSLASVSSSIKESIGEIANRDDRPGISGTDTSGASPQGKPNPIQHDSLGLIMLNAGFF